MYIHSMIYTRALIQYNDLYSHIADTNVLTSIVSGILCKIVLYIYTWLEIDR